MISLFIFFIYWLALLRVCKNNFLGRFTTLFFNFFGNFIDGAGPGRMPLIGRRAAGQPKRKTREIKYYGIIN
jgi:hypothetical protein